MAMCDVHWWCPTLRKHCGMNVIVPNEGTPPFPVFYLLHGLSDDYTIWLRRTRIEAYVEAMKRPMIVVMPDGFRGFYTNTNDGVPYAKYIAKDVVDFVDRTFPTQPTRDARYIGGLSMGGYGALRLALGYPQRFASATSHSGALLAGSFSRDASAPDQPEFIRIFGVNPEGTDHDLVKLARAAQAAKLLPRLRIDCGVDDFLISQNRTFHQQLDELAIPHEYEEFDGAHNWDYWDVHVREALKFHSGNAST